jgi:hypothetical protein
MCAAPVLQQPDFERRFFLQVDASAYGVGAILSQEGRQFDISKISPSTAAKPKLHPIAYYSVTFTPTERNYNIYERELLAVMKSLMHWRQYLGWTKEPFTVLKLRFCTRAPSPAYIIYMRLRHEHSIALCIPCSRLMSLSIYTCTFDRIETKLGLLCNTSSYCFQSPLSVRT